jgi:hypothetical protein
VRGPTPTDAPALTFFLAGDQRFLAFVASNKTAAESPHRPVPLGTIHNIADRRLRRWIRRRAVCPATDGFVPNVGCCSLGSCCGPLPLFHKRTYFGRTDGRAHCTGRADRASRNQRDCGLDIRQSNLGAHLKRNGRRVAPCTDPPLDNYFSQLSIARGLGGVSPLSQ